MTLDLQTPLADLKGIGPARSKALAAAGFERVLDLLFHLPLRYEDRRRVSRVADVDTEGKPPAAPRKTPFPALRCRPPPAE